MTSDHPTIVLVSGGWHGLPHIKPAVQPLESLGYRVLPCPLPSARGLGAQREDIDAIESAIKGELKSGRDVVLVLHSMAGRLGAEAANNILASREPNQGQIKNIIFLASFLTNEQRDVCLARLIGAGYMVPGTGSNEGFWFVDRPHEIFFNDMSPEQYKPFVDALTVQTAYAGTGLEDHTWKGIPHVLLRTTRDNTTLPEFQTWVAEQCGMEVVDIDAGHAPFVSKPEKFAEVIDGILTS